MIELYNKFLEDKTNNSVWKLAKQLSYPNIDKIVNDLTIDFSKLKTRNSIALRYLGFIDNNHGDNLSVSKIGEYFLKVTNKQEILDNQVLQISLSDNSRIKLDIYPIKILLLILKELKYFTFDEYKYFICWINSYTEIDTVINIIQDYRINNDQYKPIFDKKIVELGIQNFDDNIKRFFNLFLLASYITQKDTNYISNLDNDDIDYKLKILDDKPLEYTNSISNTILNEPEPLYNDSKITDNNLKMINNLTSQESLLLLSLLTKPFSILYGVSGTGKSRVVKELWEKMYPGKDVNGNNVYEKYFNKEAVPPNWFDETEVLGRYNEIEKYKEGSFTKILEKSIKDTKNNYVYLLDEMNLSHIEQYFAQYLSSVEDLNKGNGWINIGDTTTYSVKKKLENNLSNEIIINMDNPTKLSGKYNYVKGELNIDGTEIISNSNFADFHIKIGKYIIDNFLIEEGDIDKNYILEKTGLTTIEKLKEEGLVANNEDKIDFEKEGGITFYVKKEKWEEQSSWGCFYYKGYVLGTGYNHDLRLKNIKKLVDFLGVKNDDIKVTFSSKEKTIISKENENIIYYYNESNELVGKSLKLPKNLFVVGTINLDETTKSISPKVVDRANLIEFNDIGDFLGIEDEESRYKLNFLDKLDIDTDFNKFLEIRGRIGNLQGGDDTFKSIGLSTTTENSIKKLYSFLKVFKLHFSYRTIKEIIIFILIGKELLKNSKEKNIENKLFDIAVMQKVLPKLNGVIDYNLKLHLEDKDHKDNKYLWYDIEDSLLSDKIKKDINKGFTKYDDDFTNSAIKLERMQQFFDTYQNVNYFLS